MRSFCRWGNVILFAAMIIINSLANILPLNGNTTGNVSEKYPTLFTPAPYTFAIWGIIYIMMCFFTLYTTILAKKSDVAASALDSVGIWFMLSCLFNIGWIFTWHYEKLGLSVICILGLLATLIVINLRFTIQPEISAPARIFVYGFNIYLGWICAATIANIGVFLQKIGWTRFGLSEQFWMIVLIIVIALLGIAFVVIGGRYMSTVALVWALAGILVKHLSASGYNREYPTISVLLFGIIILLLLCVLSYPVLSSMADKLRE